MEPWYKIVTPRPEVRKGRSFNPDEFAIALEQVVAGTAPSDYLDPKQFFARTVFTRALRDHLGLVIRRLRGQTEDTAPVLTLITQFGGGKTHTLTALYHLVKSPKVAEKDLGVRAVLFEEGKLVIPETKVAVLVGNAWDPREGRETPWIDIARQLAGDAGVAVLGPRAKISPPGTETLTELFQLAGGRVLILCDEVLNLVNRHRYLADQLHSFFQNLTVALTGTTQCAAVISLPRSQVEMTDFDRVWQEKISKVVRRVARELIANDESEIAEVVRRRLFEAFGPKVRTSIHEAAQAYAAWCYERRAQLPPEWTAVDASSSEGKAMEHLQRLFEDCYPFHPATLSVFRRKWQTLPQYQQTRGTLAMLAQWVAWAYREGYEKARPEAFIGLGSAPLENDSFRATVLGQLGEHRLIHAIETDISGENSRARSLDGDAKGNLKDIHRRVAATILFESSGGMVDKAAHIPEIRFGIGEPGLDTTSIDNAASALEGRAFYLRKVGRDGYRFGFKPTLRKVVAERRAALDEAEIRKVEREAIRKEFDKGTSLPIISFPKDGTGIPNAPRLTIVIGDPDTPYSEVIRPDLARWTKERSKTDPRLYPGALIWCLKKDSHDLQEKVELALAWKQVKEEVEDGTLGGDFETSERQEIIGNLRGAEEEVKEEVWAGYRFVVIYDPKGT
ncbi:MAG: ATP-binding protein, partial [Nitrososphaerota archaeon]|nr:ATP-binding protein [Nitrososphaerota archaeon]